MKVFFLILPQSHVYYWIPDLNLVLDAWTLEYKSRWEMDQKDKSTMLSLYRFSWSIWRKGDWVGGGSGGVLKIAQLYGYNQTAIDSKKDAKMMFLSDSLIKESKQKVFLKITTKFFLIFDCCVWKAFIFICLRCVVQLFILLSFFFSTGYF